MRLDLGSVRVDLIRPDRFRLDGGAMFGVVPRPLWTRATPADERNRIALVAGCLVVRTADDVVLVDTGIGTVWSEKQRDIYAIENEPGLDRSLEEIGVARGDVTKVVNTHLHFDHAGGNTIERDGEIVPAFPNATYVVQRGELEWALSPTERDRASYRSECFAPVHEAGRFRTVEGDVEVAPHVSVRRVPGHTPNIQAIVVSDGGETLIFPSDLVPTRAHVPLPWIMAYDLEPLRTLTTKRDLLHEIAEKGWTLVLQHEPGDAVGRVAIENGRPVFRALR